MRRYGCWRMGDPAAESENAAESAHKLNLYDIDIFHKSQSETGTFSVELAVTAAVYAAAAGEPLPSLSFRRRFSQKVL